MIELNELEEAIAALSGLMIAEESLDSTLRLISTVANKTIIGCDCAGITLVEDGRVKSTACTDPLVAEVDADQYKTGEGPCVQAIRDNEIMLTGRASDDPRWDSFGELAERHGGIRSVLGIPLRIGDITMGALNLYGFETDAFEEQDERVGALLAGHAAVALVNVRAYEQVEERAASLERALKSRSIIEQAKGILMEREGCSDEEAFEMLVRASQTLNVKLREIAGELVRSTSGDPAESSAD